MDDYAGALLQHSWQKRPVQPNSSEQVHVECILPIGIGQYQRSSTRSGRTTSVVDQDVHTPELLEHFPNGFVDPGSCADVCLDKQFRCVSFGQRRTRGGADRRAAGCETTDDRLTPSPTSTRDKDALASELGFP